MDVSRVPLASFFMETEKRKKIKQNEVLLSGFTEEVISTSLPFDIICFTEAMYPAVSKHIVAMICHS